jgi:hypothetical protein
MGDFRRLKLHVLAVLKAPDWENGLDSLLDMPPRKIIAPLFSLLLHPPEIKWHAVTAFGVVVPRMAEQDIHEALAVMRRFLWHMQRNSSNSGWGISESMGEVMAQSERLAKRFWWFFGSGQANNFISLEEQRISACLFALNSTFWWAKGGFKKG